VSQLLQRTFPGQLPSVRRDIFNLVVPVDLSNLEDIELVVEQMQSFVKRKLPLRFGIVPITRSPRATEHAKVVYHLLDTYGLSTAMTYLESMFVAKETVSPNPVSFQALINGRKLRKDKEAYSLEDVLAGEDYMARVNNSKRWITRLSADSSIPPFFIDGAAYPRSENWLQLMSNRVNMDLHIIQRAVFEEALRQDAWAPSRFLSQAAVRRNALVIPEDERNLKIYDMDRLYARYQDTLKTLPVLPADPSTSGTDWAYVILIADLSTTEGQQLLATAGHFRTSNPGIEIVIVHNSRYVEGVVELLRYMKKRDFKPLDDWDDLTVLLDDGAIVINDTPKAQESHDEAQQHWTACKLFVQALGLLPGQQGLVVNGRLVGPILSDTDFTSEDFAQLMAYERSKRISPAYRAMEDLGLSAKITNPLSGAKISSIVATSTISDIPEGIFEQAPTLRVSSFDAWRSEHTAIEVGDAATASIRITAAVDPSSDKAQRWIPILKVLSELDGVYLKLFLNPTDRLQELPIKRFYRYILDSKPEFKGDGSLHSPGASFSGVPQEALLTVGMDVPAPWLVAPKESVHDLDNIKLSSTNHDVSAIYELEHILIEGHSREVPGGTAPRGVQLGLGTKKEPHFADTIIMANLGYFQFKANPGFYNISLQVGRSSEIFQIDSLGSSGWSPVPGDESTEVALMSFQGATLYPRLSRKPGKKMEDVLEAKANTTMDIVSQGLRFAESVLGLRKIKGEVTKAEEHAEINIFSVASGHLYERMLNIMMVSVMRHTKHTVKFWFIEQFLSPSFKDFIPYVAAEYGFRYEMVTYKWPHWLRAQTEKQREIWGYKILFLDVLFPLSLDKVIFVDADQIVRTDMIELVNLDLEGAPYGFTPMCDSRTEMEGFRFWKQGYWKNYLKGLPYHISALYVVDLHRFRQTAAGDRLRQQYHQLSADPGSLANLDQDLPNHMQIVLPIHSLPQEWLWCETWCSDESLKDAKTIDLCNNPLTKEPKLDRARRQVPEWTEYDDKIAELDRRRKGLYNGGMEATVVKKGTEAKNTMSRSHEELPNSHVVDEL
jgi:UDP-glucose:glycoprotein glucosyltransferase